MCVCVCLWIFFIDFGFDFVVLEFGVLKFGIWGLEFGVWNLEFGVFIKQCVYVCMQ